MGNDATLAELKRRLYVASNELSDMMAPYRILEHPDTGWVEATDAGTRNASGAWLTVYLRNWPTEEQQMLIPEQVLGIPIRVVVSGKYTPNVTGEES